MKLPENRLYSRGVSKNLFPQFTTSVNNILDIHLVSMIFCATKFCYNIEVVKSISHTHKRNLGRTMSQVFDRGLNFDLIKSCIYSFHYIVLCGIHGQKYF